MRRGEDEKRRRGEEEKMRRGEDEKRRRRGASFRFCRGFYGAFPSRRWCGGAIVRGGHSALSIEP